jgi:hypothetical protein
MNAALVGEGASSDKRSPVNRVEVGYFIDEV